MTERQIQVSETDDGFPAWCPPETLESLESLLERLAREMSYTEKNWLETLPTPLRLPSQT